MSAVFRDIFGARLLLTPACQRHILSEHPEMKPYLARLEEVFRAPIAVKHSRRDPQVYLYYRYDPDILGGKYLLGVARIGRHAEVLTAYVTDIMKKGVLVWPKH